MTVSVLLVNPKTPFNVSAAIRSGVVFGADSVYWTGSRIVASETRVKVGSTIKKRWPREERMKDYARKIVWRRDDQAFDKAVASGLTPVCVEVSEYAEQLPGFVHPVDAVYVFGPEDGNIPKGIRGLCHRFVTIPSANRTPLNLAAAVNIVLYDRFAKEMKERDAELQRGG